MLRSKSQKDMEGFVSHAKSRLAAQSCPATLGWQAFESRSRSLQFDLTCSAWRYGL